MRPFAFILLFLSVQIFIPIKIVAQVNSGARFTAMANAGTAMEDVFSLGSNQAGITSLKYSKIAFEYREHFYSSNTRSLAALAVLPTKAGNLGLYADRYSFEKTLEEVRVGLTYARFFGPKLSLATTINYHRLFISESFAEKTLSFDLGFQYHLTEHWLWGIHLVNPVGLFINEAAAYQLPIKFRLGTSYMMSSQVLLAMESEYDWGQHYDFRLGLEYSILNWLKLRGGTSVNPFQYFAGAGLVFQRIQLDVASSFHPLLGISPQLSVSYGF